MRNNQPPSGNPHWPPPPAAPVPQDLTLRFRLVMPITRIGSGFFSIDPLEKALGTSLEEILKPALVGPVFRRPSVAGPAVDVYPLGLPDGEHVAMRLGQWGELALGNDRGFLRLAVPWHLGEWVRQRLGPVVVRGPEQALSVDGTAWVAWLWIQLQPGMGMTLPIGSFGEVAVEAG